MNKVLSFVEPSCISAIIIEMNVWQVCLNNRYNPCFFLICYRDNFAESDTLRQETAATSDIFDVSNYPSTRHLRQSFGWRGGVSCENILILCLGVELHISDFRAQGVGGGIANFEFEKVVKNIPGYYPYSRWVLGDEM